MAALHGAPGAPAVANEGFGPDGRKKLKAAAVETAWPSRVASGAGQLLSTPRIPGTTVLNVHGPALEGGVAVTVNGLDGVSPAASAFAKFAMSREGFDGFMFRGRFR